MLEKLREELKLRKLKNKQFHFESLHLNRQTFHFALLSYWLKFEKRKVALRVTNSNRKNEKFDFKLLAQQFDKKN